jgi:4-amino-4-deoxy-L-arabinose transferase-like glycosyltransferase
MHTVWAMLVGGLVSERVAEAAAGATIFLFFPLLLMAVYRWMSEIGASKTAGLIAALMVASIPTAFQVASSGYIDIALALYVTLAVYSLSKWSRTGDKGWLVMIAIFLGAALSIKLTALFIFAAFALLILLRARNAGEQAARIAGGGFAALALAAVIASPWYLRNWYTTGSPVFPFYMSIWRGEAPGWDVERSNLFQAINSEYGGSNKTPVDYMMTPWRLSVSADREVPRLFDGVLGPAFLFGLPILIVGVWKFDLPHDAKLGAAAAGIVFAFWLFSSQQLRYLLPIIPLLALSIAVAAEGISAASRKVGQIWRYGTVALCLTGMLVSTAWFSEKAPLPVVLGGETRDSYLSRNLDYYPFYQQINSDPAPDASVWLINMRRDTYHVNKRVVSDYMFEDWTLKKMLWEARSAQELKAKAAALGIKYILTRHDFLFDYDRSTLVDDKRPRVENEGKLQIARELILDKANMVRSNEKFSLVKVF